MLGALEEAPMNRIVRYAFWPLFVLLSFAAFAFGLARGELLLTFALVPPLQGLFVLAAEVLWPEVPGSSTWRDPQLWNDLFHNLVGQGFGNQLGAMLVAGAMALLAGAGGERFGASLWSSLWPAGTPFAVQALVFVFLADGIECLRHRAEHSVPWLWRIHALHHDVDRMNLVKSGRGHFLDMVLRHAIVFLPFAAIGVPTGILAWYPAAAGILGPIGHANVEVRVPGFVHKLLMTPQIHKIHHARALALSLCNYANVFPVWDVLFGSFGDPARVAPDGYGVENGHVPRSLWGQIAAPFAWRRSTGGAAS
jgi:sterol desaturase/sphingolipid hydroxylase (fatty acid hydroxylase superfamily)